MPNPERTLYRAIAKRLFLIFAVTTFALWSLGCGRPKAAESEKPVPPAKVENAVKESDLATVKLTPQAEARLGVTTALVTIERVAQTRTFAGEIVLPPDHTTSLTAPINGTLAANDTPLTVGVFVRKGQALFRLVPCFGLPINSRESQICCCRPSIINYRLSTDL